MGRENYLKKTVEAFAIAGALLGPAQAEAGGGGRVFEATELAQLEEKAMNLFGKNSLEDIRDAHTRARQEATERKRPEILNEIPCRDGTITREEVMKFFDLLPRNWFDGEVRTIEFVANYKKDSEGKTNKKTLATWDRETRTITFFKPIRNKPREQVFETLIHEGAHTEDWLSSFDLSLGERYVLELATESFDAATGRQYDSLRNSESYKYDDNFTFLTEVAAYTIEDYLGGYFATGSQEEQFAEFYLSYLDPDFDAPTALGHIRVLINGTSKNQSQIASRQTP